MKLKLTNVVMLGVFLTACSVQSSNSTLPVVGTCDEFSTQTSGYVILPVRGEVLYSMRDIRIELKSTLTIFGYPVLVCKGREERRNDQNIVEFDLTCTDGSFGTAFINLVQDKNDIGNGLFSLSNGTYGTFQFGLGLLVGQQA
jgi:hypothetical protein